MDNDPPESSSSSPAAEPPGPGPHPRAQRPLGRVLRYTRGLILNQHLRRLTMFYVIIAAMIMAFAGEIFLGGWLHHNPWRFLGYYVACAGLTVVAALLAIYDILMIRLQHRFIRKRLRSEILGDEHKDEE